MNLLTSITNFFLRNVIRRVRLLLASKFRRDDCGLLFLLFPVVNVCLASLFVGCIIESGVSRNVAHILCTVSAGGSQLGKRGY